MVSLQQKGYKMEEIKKFLLDYLELCLKYNLQVSSCGCCNSPYLIRSKQANFITFYKNVDIENICVDFDDKCIEFDKDGVSYKMNIKGEVKEIRRW